MMYKLHAGGARGNDEKQGKIRQHPPIPATRYAEGRSAGETAHGPWPDEYSGKLVAAMRVAIRQAPKSREVIAEEMSELTGCTISVHQVNNWTAESHSHRIPGEWVPAFCEVTQDFGPMRLLAETAGVYTLPGPDALRAEIQKLDEDARNIRNEKRKRELFLKEIER